MRWAYAVRAALCSAGNQHDVVLLAVLLTCHRTVVWMYEPALPHSTGEGMPYSARIASISASLASQISFFRRPTVLSSKNRSG